MCAANPCILYAVVVLLVSTGEVRVCLCVGGQS